MKEYAQSHFNLPYKIYLDDNISGVTFEREGLDRLKKDIERGIIQILLLKDLSRLGRNNAKTLLFIDYLEENNVRLITIDGRYDSDKDNDTVGIDTWYNERYAKDISKKIRANIGFKIRNGEYIGKAPFGYKKSSLHKNKLEIKEEEASVVKEVFSLYQKEYGYKRIAQIINQKYQHRDYNFSPIKIKRILQNRVYIGETIQGVSKKVSYKTKKTVRLPKDEWVITPNTHSSIISEQEFLKVQAIRGKKGNNYGSNKGKISLFRGLIFCGDCKSGLNYIKNKGKDAYYICSNYMRNGKEACNRHAIKEDALIQEVKMRLLELMEDEASLKKAIKIYKTNNTYMLDKVDKISLRKRVQNLKNKQQVLYMDRLNMNISIEIFTKINKELESKIQDLNKQIEQEENNNPNKRYQIGNVLNSLKELEITREVIKILVDRIIVYDNPRRIYIEFT